MGGTVSYILWDGSIQDTNDYIASQKSNDWHVMMASEPSATGVTSYAEIPNLIQNMKNNNITPFLVMHHSYENVKTNSLMITHWDDSGTGGWDWSVRHVISDIVATNETQRNGEVFLSNYIRVGDSVSWNSGAGDGDAVWVDNMKYRHWLFAHKSICYDCPAQAVMSLSDSQVLYTANVANTPGDVPSLYHPLGFFARHKNGKCVAVLKAFLKAGPWPGMAFDVHEDCCDGPYWFLNQSSRGGLNFVNTLAVSHKRDSLNVNYEICITVDEALNNVLKCVLQNSTQGNQVFQGFTTANGTRHENNASKFMRAFCNSTLESTEFPIICSCLGRAGVEDALKTELGDERIRMVCYSTECLSGQSSGKVYTFEPSPPCAPINICKPEIDINAVKVSMTDVTFNCNGEKTDIPPPPPPPPPPSSDSSGSPPPADSTQPTADTNNTGLIIGAAVGGVVLIICIIVIVVVIKRSKTKPKVLKAMKTLKK